MESCFFKLLRNCIAPYLVNRMTKGTPIRVLTYVEDSEHCAHALELDLVATGETEQEALDELAELIICQLSFCKQEGLNPYTPAPSRY